MQQIVLALFGLIAFSILMGTAAWLLNESLTRRLKNEAADRTEELRARLTRIEAMVLSLADTRETTMQHSFSLDQNLDMLESRVAHLERQADQKQLGANTASDD